MRQHSVQLRQQPTRIEFEHSNIKIDENNNDAIKIESDEYETGGSKHNQQSDSQETKKHQGYLRPIQIPEGATNQFQFIPNNNTMIMLKNPISIDASNQILNNNHNLIHRRIVQANSNQNLHQSAFNQITKNNANNQNPPNAGPPNVDMGLIQQQIQQQQQQHQNAQSNNFNLNHPFPHLQNLIRTQSSPQNQQQQQKAIIAQQMMAIRQQQSQNNETSLFDSSNVSTSKPGKKNANEKKRKPRDPNEPKKPPTAFFLFMKSNREKIRLEHPDAKVTGIAKIAGELWRNMDSDARHKYTLYHDGLKKIYDEQIECFKKGEKYEGQQYDDILPVEFRKTRGLYGQAVARKRKNNNTGSNIETSLNERGDHDGFRESTNSLFSGKTRILQIAQNTANLQQQRFHEVQDLQTNIDNAVKYEENNNFKLDNVEMENNNNNDEQL